MLAAVVGDGVLRISSSSCVALSPVVIFDCVTAVFVFALAVDRSSVVVRVVKGWGSPSTRNYRIAKLQQ